MESIIFVSVPFKGVFWDFKVDQRILLTQTVYTYYFFTVILSDLEGAAQSPPSLKQHPEFTHY